MPHIASSSDIADSVALSDFSPAVAAEVDKIGESTLTSTLDQTTTNATPPLNTNEHEDGEVIPAASINEEGDDITKKRRRNRKEHPVSFWHRMCQHFVDNPATYENSQIVFLRSPDSDPLDESYKVSFGKRLRMYREGALPQDDSVKRLRKGKYQDVEKCLIAFIETRDKFSKGKTAITWPFLTEMAKRFAAALGHDSSKFQASPGWISNVLKRNKTSLSVELNDEDMLYYIESVKKYCKKAKMGREIDVLSDRLHKLVKQKVKGDEEVRDLLYQTQQDEAPSLGDHRQIGIGGEPSLPTDITTDDERLRFPPPGMPFWTTPDHHV